MREQHKRDANHARLEERKHDGAARTAELARTVQELRQEIAERRRAEDLLQAAAKDWQEAFDATPDAICVLDAEGRIRRCNQALVRLAGQPAEALLGQSFGAVLPCGAGPCRECLLSHVRDSRQRARVVVPCGERWYAVTADPLHNEQGELTGIVHVMSDITAQRPAEEARETAEVELQKQRMLGVRADRLRSLGQMAAGIAHELYQPLVGVRGLAEHLLIGLERGWDVSAEKLREKLTLVVEQADRMSHIIEHVRTFARDAAKLEFRAVQLNHVVRSALGLVGAQIRARGLVLDCELADSLPTVWANPFSLEEVVLNLLVNAADAVAEAVQAGVQPAAPQILLSTRLYGEPAARIEFQVLDRGTGIPAETLTKVFEPFFTTKASDQGTGLGLAICKSIVEKCRGTIGVNSAPGQGTTVTVSWPAEFESAHPRDFEDLRGSPPAVRRTSGVRP
jgi:PAS domain S-box-containing protein